MMRRVPLALLILTLCSCATPVNWDSPYPTNAYVFIDNYGEAHHVSVGIGCELAESLFDGHTLVTIWQPGDTKATPSVVMWLPDNWMVYSTRLEFEGAESNSEMVVPKSLLASLSATVEGWRGRHHGAERADEEGWGDPPSAETLAP
jgi:hypothetical protein